jgi:hypothetical protein
MQIRIKSTFLTILFGTSVAFSAQQDVRVHFDPGKLSMKEKDGQTLFTYDDPTSRYIEHQTGSPVLPGITLYVLMPAGARYKSCSVNASAQPLKGSYDVYTRQKVDYMTYTAERFPPRLVEFVQEGDLDGYRVFVFRAYPIACQPGDGSVSRILHSQLRIEYEKEDATATGYEPQTPAQETAIRRRVVNPHDLADFTHADTHTTYKREDPLTRQRNAVAREAFATQIRERKAAERQSKLHYLHDVPEIELARNKSAIEEMQEQVYINQDNDIVYAPIEF